MSVVISHISTICFLCCCSLISLAQKQKGGTEFVADVIEQGFAAPPDSVRVGCYWYWLNDNVSKEGVVADLLAMKQAGITSAYIAFLGKLSYPYGDWAHPCPKYGDVKFMSDGWWEALHTALKTAGELDIELGIFNSPGWSQAGGRWVKPQQAMRYLAVAERRVKGPTHLSERIDPPQKNRDDVYNYLDAVDEHLFGIRAAASETKTSRPTTSELTASLQVKPSATSSSVTNAHTTRFADSLLPLINNFQDVKVIAFPIDNNERANLFNTRGASIKCTPQMPHKYELSANEKTIITLRLPEEATARSLMIVPGKHLYADCELQAQQGANYITVKRFNIVRTHRRPIEGYDARAPIAVSFPEIKATEFRLVFTNTQKNSIIDSILLTPSLILERYAEKKLSKMSKSYLWNAYMWDATSSETDFSIVPDKIIDISDHLSSDGTLTWDVPEGEWVIMRTGMSPTGVVNNPASREATGLEVDKTNSRHVEAHFDAFIGEILRRIPAVERPTLKYVVMDSYETGGQNFTDNMLDTFRQRYGYDPVPFLPVFQGYTVGSPDISDRFLWDVRRLIADLTATEFVAGLRRASNRAGLATWLENYGHWGFPGEFLQYGGQSDEIAGEFWSGGNQIEVAAAVSCAHIYGKNRVWAESFTHAGMPYQRHPGNLKQFADKAFAEGVNASVLHVYVHQLADAALPGLDFWASTEFNRKNTWFRHLDLFTLYLRRCGFLLQQGLHVADVLYFIGEDAPKMSGTETPPLPDGYHADFINSEVIMRDLQVKDGRFVLPHGASYSVLVLPPQKTMRPELLEKIVTLAEAGGCIIGTLPTSSPSLQNYPAADLRVAKMAENLKKQVKQTNLVETLSHLDIAPDCSTGNKDVLFTHRTLGEQGDIYFLTNQKNATVKTLARFRVSGMQPSLWNAVDGSVRTCPVATSSEKTTDVELELAPFQSVFVMFVSDSDSLSSRENRDSLSLRETISTAANWSVTFNSDSIHRGPAEPVTFTTLTDWSKHENPAIRYYSGTAVYKNSFKLRRIPKNLTKKARITLELDRLSAMAKVKINGAYAGGLWTAPYRLDITPFVRTGANEIEIELVNSWQNRIIGDMQLPESERKVRPQANPYKASSPLQESGITGDIRIYLTF